MTNSTTAEQAQTSETLTPYAALMGRLASSDLSAFRGEGAVVALSGGRNGRFLTPYRDAKHTQYIFVCVGVDGHVRVRAYGAAPTLRGASVGGSLCKGAWVLTAPKSRFRQQNDVLADAISRALDVIQTGTYPTTPPLPDYWQSIPEIPGVPGLAVDDVPEHYLHNIVEGAISTGGTTMRALQAPIGGVINWGEATVDGWVPVHITNQHTAREFFVPATVTVCEDVEAGQYVRPGQQLVRLSGEETAAQLRMLAFHSVPRTFAGTDKLFVPTQVIERVYMRMGLRTLPRDTQLVEDWTGIPGSWLPAQHPTVVDAQPAAEDRMGSLAYVRDLPAAWRLKPQDTSWVCCDPGLTLDFGFVPAEYRAAHVPKPQAAHATR